MEYRYNLKSEGESMGRLLGDYFQERGRSTPDSAYRFAGSLMVTWNLPANQAWNHLESLLNSFPNVDSCIKALNDYDKLVDQMAEEFVDQILEGNK